MSESFQSHLILFVVKHWNRLFSLLVSILNAVMKRKILYYFPLPVMGVKVFPRRERFQYILMLPCVSFLLLCTYQIKLKAFLSHESQMQKINSCAKELVLSSELSSTILDKDLKELNSRWIDTHKKLSELLVIMSCGGFFDWAPLLSGLKCL